VSWEGKRMLILSEQFRRRRAFVKAQIREILDKKGAGKNKRVEPNIAYDHSYNKGG